jgi:predicted Zn-dependent protease
VVDAGRAQAVRQSLRELEEALGPAASPTTLAAVQAGLLAGEGLVHDARLAVLAALAKDADEPALHMLLGTLYLKAGLAEQAAAAFDEADFLLTRAN